jgi:hypothetical protein
MTAMIRVFLALIGALAGFVLVLPFIIAGIPFYLVAFFTRGFCRLLEAKVIPWQDLMEFDPFVGWKAKANLKTYCNVDGVCYLTTDGQGWRGRTELRDSDVVIFGDSFAFGYGVDDKNFFADLNPQVRIKSIGTNGYNMVQSLLWMQRLSPQLSGKLIVWFIYIGNDLYENLQPNLQSYRMPFVRLIPQTDRWEIVTHHISRAKWPIASQRQYYHRLAEICGPTHLAQRVYSACEFLVTQGKEVCNQSGAELIVMTIPDSNQLTTKGAQRLLRLAPNQNLFDQDYPDQKISDICARRGISFIALKDHLTLANHKERDCHWNESGHRRVSHLLCSLLDARMKRAPVLNGKQSVLRGAIASDYERQTVGAEDRFLG